MDLRPQTFEQQSEARRRWDAKRAEPEDDDDLERQIAGAEAELQRRREAIHNANLISAAPDMYAAIENLLTEMGKWGNDDDGLPKGAHNAWLQAKVAMKKARGE